MSPLRWIPSLSSSALVGSLTTCALDHRAHLGELREDQRPVADFVDLFEHLGEAGQLAGTAGDGRTVVQELRRVVADLLELQQGSQNEPFALDTLALVERTRRLLDDSPVEGGLLFGQRGEDVHLQLLGQIIDDGLIRLHATQDERPGQPFQPVRGLRIAVGLDRQEKLAFERGLGAEKARVEKLHDRPQLADVVFYGGAGQGDAMISLERAGRLGLFGLGVFDVLRLVQDDGAPLDLLEQVEVAVQQRIARDDDSLLLRLLLEGGLFLGATRTMMQEDRQRGREARRLLLPVAHHGGRTDEQHGPFILRRRVARMSPLRWIPSLSSSALVVSLTTAR